MKIDLRLLAVLCLAAGCGGGNVYPDSDVVEPSGFELKIAKGMQMSENSLQAGTLEYEGAGELNAVFRGYIDAMKTHGWAHHASEVAGDKATGTLRKGVRSCALTFTNTNGRIRAVITVAVPK